jgi:Uma2 family endonuclease
VSKSAPPAHATGAKTEALPSRRRFSVDEYYRMAEIGILGPDERVELLEGDIYAMAAMGSRHASRISFLDRWLNARVGGRAIVRAQFPIHFSSGSEPEPDLALVRLRSEDPDYGQAHPGMTTFFC